MKLATVFKCDHCDHYDPSSTDMARHEEDCLREKQRIAAEHAAFWEKVERCRKGTVEAALASKAVRGLVEAGSIEEARLVIYDLMTEDINSAYLCVQIADEAIERIRKDIAGEQEGA